MQTRMKIAVAGGTGRVGGHLVELLEAGGHEVVAMSRSTGVDVVTGAGLPEALEGVEAIVDAATGPSPDQEAATQFFTAAARNLQEAGQRAGVGRMVVVSIIGIDKFIGGYQAAKAAQEQAHLAGPIPVRIVRAAQFHEFVGQMMGWGIRGDVGYVPDMRTQLVAARTVAEVLADLVTSPESTFRSAEIIEVAGPREETLVQAATLLAARRGEPASVEAVPADPDDPDSVAYASGALLPGPGALLGGPTFEEWLEATIAAAPGESVTPDG